MNDPARTGLCVGQRPSLYVGAGLSGDAARLLGRYIATNDHMDELYISNLMDAVGSLFEGLRGSRSLTQLDIALRLSEQLVQSVLPFLMNAPKLKELGLNLGRETLRPILRTLNGSTIEKLSLENSDIADGDLSAIGSCNLPNLQSLSLMKSGITSVPPLYGFPNLTTLSLCGNKIDKDGFTRLNEYLASDSCRLDSLNLCNTGMEDEDISSIAGALKHNRSVTKLDLRGNHCCEAGYRSMKKLVDISSIKATLASDGCLWEIDLHKHLAAARTAAEILSDPSEDPNYGEVDLAAAISADFAATEESEEADG